MLCSENKYQAIPKHSFRNCFPQLSLKKSPPICSLCFKYVGTARVSAQLSAASLNPSADVWAATRYGMDTGVSQMVSSTPTYATYLLMVLHKLERTLFF